MLVRRGTSAADPANWLSNLAEESFQLVQQVPIVFVPFAGAEKIAIESARLVEWRSLDQLICGLEVKVRSLVAHFIGVSLLFNAFEASGAGFAFTLLGGGQPPGSTVTYEQVFGVPPGRGTPCSRIARVQLDPTGSLVTP